MKTIAIAFLAATLALPAVAQVPAQAPAAPAEKKAPSCPCDQYGFKPVTDKATAVVEYWQARRKTKIAAVIGGTGLLFSLLLQNPNGLRESTEGYDRARSEMWTARRKAEELGALVVRGDDLDGDIQFKIVEGVDYVIQK